MPVVVFSLEVADRWNR